MEDTIDLAEGKVYSINFRPKKNVNFDGLTGTLFVGAHDASLRHVLAREAKETVVPLQFFQSYRQQPAGHWLPEQLRTRFEWQQVSTARTSLAAEMSSYLTTAARPPAAEAMRHFDPIVLSAEGESNRWSEARWNKARGNTFTPTDRQTYRLYDSLRYDKNLDRLLRFAEKLHSGRLPAGPVDIEVRKLLRINAWEGFRPGLGLISNASFSTRYTAGIYAGYGIADKKPKYHLFVAFPLAIYPDATVTAGYQRDLSEAGGTEFAFNTPQYSSEWLRDLLVLKMDRLSSFYSTVQARVFRDVQVQLGLSRTNRMPLYGYMYVPQAADQTGREPFRMLEFSAGLRFAFRERFVATPHNRFSVGTRWPVLWYSVRQGVNGLGANWNYTRSDVKVQYSRRWLGAGTTGIQAVAGSVSGHAPYGLLYNGHGSLKVPSVVIHNSFETMRYNEFLSDRYLAFFLSHNFGKFLIRREGFEPTVEVLHNMGWGSLRNPEVHQEITFKTMNRGYLESGVFLNDLFLVRFYLLKMSLGSGFFFRYGAYAEPQAVNNIFFKFSLRLGI